MILRSPMYRSAMFVVVVEVLSGLWVRLIYLPVYLSIYLFIYLTISISIYCNLSISVSIFLYLGAPVILRIVTWATSADTLLAWVCLRVKLRRCHD